MLKVRLVLIFGEANVFEVLLELLLREGTFGFGELGLHVVRASLDSQLLRSLQDHPCLDDLIEYLKPERLLLGGTWLLRSSRGLYVIRLVQFRTQNLVAVYLGHHARLRGAGSTTAPAAGERELCYNQQKKEGKSAQVFVCKHRRSPPGQILYDTRLSCGWPTDPQTYNHCQ